MSTSFCADLTRYPLYILPNNSQTRQFAQEMNKNWLQWDLPPPLSFNFRDLQFIFLEDEDQLEAVYFDDPTNKGVHLAIVLDPDPFQNM